MSDVGSGEGSSDDTGRLLVPGISDEALAKMNRSYLAGPVVYGSATLIAFVQPYVSLAIFAALPCTGCFPAPGRGLRF